MQTPIFPVMGRNDNDPETQPDASMNADADTVDAVYDVPIRSRRSWGTILFAAMIVVPIALIISAIIQSGASSLLSWRILLIIVIDAVLWLLARYFRSTGTVDAEDLTALYDGIVAVEPDQSSEDGLRAVKSITVPMKDGDGSTFSFQYGEERDAGLTGPAHIHEAALIVRKGMAAVMVPDPTLQAPSEDDGRQTA